MQKKDVLLVVGAGGHGRAVAEAAQLSGQWSEVRFVDDGHPTLQSSGAWPVVGHTDDLASLVDSCRHAIVAIGNQADRARQVEQLENLGFALTTVIHPRAWVSEYARIGKGCAIMAGAVVGAYAEVGRGAIVNANATIDHDGSLKEFAHLGVGVQLAGGVSVGARAWLQTGVCAGYRVEVADDVVIGPGEKLVGA